MKKLGCILLVLLLLLMTGCGVQDEWEVAKKAAALLSDVTEDPQLRENTEKMLDALIAEDFLGAYAVVMYSGITDSDFRQVYEQIVPLLAEVEAYELIPSYIGKNITNGVSTTSVRYMMTAGEQRFFVETARAEGHDGLVAFYIDTYIPVVTTGTLGNMQGANVLQWILLVIGMLGTAFVIWMFVDCCRHKLRRKWLWLLIIALGYLLISLIATPEQFRVSFNVGAYLSYTSLVRYSTGGFTLRLVVPLGAVIYAALRKKLFAKYELYVRQKEQAAKQAQQPAPYGQEIPSETEVWEEKQ